MSSLRFPDKFPDLHDALSRFEQVLSRPVLLLAAGWQEPYGVTLDEDAAMRWVNLLATLPECALPPAVFLYARGCTPAFADTLRRAHVDIHVTYVMGRTLGATTSVALRSRELVLLPGAGLGAADVIVSPQTVSAPDADLFRYAMAGHDLLDEHLARRRAVLALARERRAQELAERVLAATLAPHFDEASRARVMEVVEALSRSRLGDALGLGLRELVTLGLNVREPIDGEERAAALALAGACEDVFAVMTRPRAVFNGDSLGEVEFELASGEPGALLATTHAAYFLELDTGSPDPDTGRLMGDWQSL